MKQTKKAGIILFWVFVWFCLSRIINKSLVLVGPEQVIEALCRLLPTSDFWQTVFNSLKHIGLGFLGGFCSGILLGVLAYAVPWLRDWLQPVVSLMKAVPVAAFVILALMFMGSKNLAILIVWILVVPIVYYSTLNGLQNTDPQLLEMAHVFRIPPLRRVGAIYGPALRPFLVSAAQTAVGMSWKSGVAAEVIGVSTGSIGEQLYLSKVYLETAELFAWTVTIIVLSALCEKLIVALLRRGL